MGEIKFRAWDKTEDKMREVLGINMFRKDLWLRYDEKNTVGANFFEVNLMQYTGLKDKNGVEIYEGDILLYLDTHKSIINYKNGAFTRSYHNSNTYLLYDSFIEDGKMIDYEVIGNIYEDKNLLEEK